ncbi:carbohydrate kinase family protein [Actinoplanes sp. NPDC024001]|uniref:carbohydrate kinase family protein n=1 Tax=Actinoplanes sp. NPDC024001 TaxID=3154598 RepID=UPI0033FA02C1
MRVLLTGSIATDYLMTFPGRFAAQIVPDRIDQVSLSFLVDDLDVRYGGVAANIAVGMRRLGLDPVLAGAVGADFGDYGRWLTDVGVDISHLRISHRHHTSRFLCTTDQDGNQIASFYPGAMAEAREIELAAVVEAVGGVDLVVIAPNDPEAMLRHTEECRRRGYEFAADPSQQLPRFDGDDITRLTDGARFLFANQYESGLIAGKTGRTEQQTAGRVGALVVTHGAGGVRVLSRGEPDLEVPAVAGIVPRDPTGGGDAFRAGFLAGTGRGLSPRRCAELGCLLASVVLESVGTQDYLLDPTDLRRRCAETYGTAAAAEIFAAPVGAGRGPA